MKNKYEIRGDVTAIFLLYKGITLETIIDTIDLPKAQEYPNTWFAQYSKTIKNYYVSGRTVKNGRAIRFRLHRLVMECPDDLMIDHENHNTLDNRKNKLRIVTHAGNMQNLRSRYKNVAWSERFKKWEVSIKFEGKTRHIGLYEKKSDANHAAKQARAKFYPYSIEAKKVKIDPDFNCDFSQDRLFSSNKSGHRNVHWNKLNKKWCVQIRKNNKVTHIGYFINLEEAVKVAEEARAKQIN